MNPSYKHPATRPESLGRSTYGDPAALVAGDPRDPVAGLGPWQLALRRLKRNRVALAFGGLFLVIVLMSIGCAAVGRSRRA